MGRFTRARGKLSLHLDGDERQILGQLVNEFIGLIDDVHDPLASDPITAAGPQSTTEDEDPFALWEASFGASPSIEDDPAVHHWGLEDDPILQRLFPPAYVDDPEAASDFHRFTRAEQQRAKIAEAMTVLDDLDAIRRGSVRIASDHVDAWMRTLNNLRLVISVMLGITDEVSHAQAAARPERDPGAWLFSVYGWLGWMLESLLDCVMDVDASDFE